MSGFTAKLAGTERGITEPTPTFSACFGAAFLSLHPTKYGEELVKKMKQGGCQGISREHVAGTEPASVFRSKDTRGIIDAILDGSIDKAPTKTHAYLRLRDSDRSAGRRIPRSSIRATLYKNAKDWDVKAEDLANRFVKNFEKFTGNEAGKKLVAAGPKVK
ncbi:MAG: phosphoenolpyruvate carboxykinase (ATP) [Alistipes finegoldii]